MLANLENEEGQTPLHVVVLHRGMHAVTELLRREDTDVSVHDHKGRTALHHAVQTKLTTDIIKALLTLGHPCEHQR